MQKQADTKIPSMEELEVLRDLGHGGFASVYLCREKATNRLVALKRIPLNRLATPEQKRRASVEQHLLENARHPFLSHGFRTFEDREFLSFVMAYIKDSRPLYQCIWRYKTGSAFPEHVAKYFAAQIVVAVEELHHMGYLHRDLKSGNVLIDVRGVAHVIDYGFAKEIQPREKDLPPEQRTYSVCGTHYIMAPEMYLRQPYGVELDWWGVGVIIHEMICGRPPWDYKPSDGSSPQSFFDTISEVAKGFSMGQEASAALATADVSDECRSIVKSLLLFNPRKRLGHEGGAAQVKGHPWFKDVDWASVHTATTSSPYDPVADYRDDTPPIPHGGPLVSSSSAESIDPEDNAKYFAAF